MDLRPSAQATRPMLLRLTIVALFLSACAFDPPRSGPTLVVIGGFAGDPAAEAIEIGLIRVQARPHEEATFTGAAGEEIGRISYIQSWLCHTC